MEQMVLKNNGRSPHPAKRPSLRGCAEQLRLSLCAARAGSWAWDLESGETYYSEELCDALGLNPSYSSNAPSEATWIEQIHPDDRKLLQVELRGAIDERRDFECEFRILRMDGDYCWTQSRGWILYDREGVPQRLIGLGMDITSRKARESEREELLYRERAAREAAEGANQGRDEFLALVSHDLRSTLNAILSWSQVLGANRNNPSAAEEAIAVIERCARMQTRLVEDLLDTACARSGKLRLEMEAIDLSKAILGAIEMAIPMAKCKGVELHFKPVSNLRYIQADPARLQQIIWNLLTNAIKFTPNGGRVELSLGVDRDRVLIRLRDTGRGIAPDLLPHIFERFRQGDSSKSRRCEGLGLGLALARDLVTLHGGTIAAESPGEGKGASFTIRLPYPATTILDTSFAEPSVVENPISEIPNAEARKLQIKLTNELQVAGCR